LLNYGLNKAQGSREAMSVNPIASVQGGVQSAIALASAKTGIDFNYLLGQAQVESGLNA